MNIAALLLIPCPGVGMGCGDPIAPILPQFDFPSLPFWAGSGVLLIVALAMLAIVGGRYARMVIILTLATPVIFIVGNLAIAAVYCYSWIVKLRGQNTIPES